MPTFCVHVVVSNLLCTQPLNHEAMNVVSALSYQKLAAAATIQNVTWWLQLKYLLMIFRPMYKGGCDVKSGKRCLYYYCVCCTLLVMYSWYYTITIV